MAEFKIFAEDSYGREFFPRLIERLTGERCIPTIKIKADRFPGQCNTKSHRAISASSDFDRIIVLVDAHGTPIEATGEKVLVHIPQGMKGKVRVVVLPYEIEEWICFSAGLKFGNKKPSEVLKRHQGYEKSQLPEFADQLDLVKLRGCLSFKGFVQALT